MGTLPGRQAAAIGNQERLLPSFASETAPKGSWESVPCGGMAAAWGWVAVRRGSHCACAPPSELTGCVEDGIL